MNEKRSFLLWYTGEYCIVTEGTPECTTEQADLLESSYRWKEVSRDTARKRRFILEVVEDRRKGQHYRRHSAPAAG